MNHSTRKPTKAEQARLDALARMPCMACVQEGVAQPSMTEIHHLVDKGTRKHSGGHMATIPLCGWHHRGQPAFGDGIVDMLDYYGPSLAAHKRSFVSTYGTERDLLARVNTALDAREEA